MTDDNPDEKPHVLVVDDDDRLRSLLAKYLSDNGFMVTAAADAEEARRRMTSLAFDLIVLDLMMPGESGLEFAEKLRVIDDIPILMLTAMSESEDRIRGLEKGGDDYLTKPFEPRELVLRIHSILKRARPEPDMPQELLFGDAVFSLDRGEMRRRGRRIHLTDVEVALLRALGATSGQVMSRDTLIAATDAGGEGRAIDVQVTRLRRKIERDPRAPRYLKTVRGKGYVLWPDNK
ncbi:response regulator [Thalassospiraceae bacterium LMO-JJ14]|nr:response regulator [Thalassospiraceae bacterium LMO-JJ14]